MRYDVCTVFDADNREKVMCGMDQNTPAQDALGNPKVQQSDRQIRFHCDEQVLTLSWIEEAGREMLLIMQGFGYITLDREQATALGEWAARALPRTTTRPYHCATCQTPLAFTEAAFSGHLAYCSEHTPTSPESEAQDVKTTWEDFKQDARLDAYHTGEE